MFPTVSPVIWKYQPFNNGQKQSFWRPPRLYHLYIFGTWHWIQCFATTYPCLCPDAWYPEHEALKDLTCICSSDGPESLKGLASSEILQVAEEARKEARRRGDEKTQTSDARFDERFQFGYGLGGARNSASQPWYAQAKAPLLAQEDLTGALWLEVCCSSAMCHQHIIRTVHQ